MDIPTEQTRQTHADPRGSRFYMWAVDPPEGDWAYALDEIGVVYSRQGWPFHLHGQPCSVRLSPDTAYQSWGNEYVVLIPGRRGEFNHSPDHARARANLFVRRQGRGAITLPVEIGIDLIAKTAELPARLPAELAKQADAKAKKILAFLDHHTTRARNGRARRPATAHSTWAAAREHEKNHR